jgi:hypothetical protein
MASNTSNIQGAPTPMREANATDKEILASGFAAEAAKFREVVGPHSPTDVMEFVNEFKGTISIGEIVVGQSCAGTLCIFLPQGIQLLGGKPGEFLMDVRLSDHGDVVMALAEFGKDADRRVKELRSLSSEMIKKLREILGEASRTAFTPYDLFTMPPVA